MITLERNGYTGILSAVQAFMNLHKQKEQETKRELRRGQGGSLHPLTVLLYTVVP